MMFHPTAEPEDVFDAQAVVATPLVLQQPRERVLHRLGESRACVA
jgi:hypothetical protein